MGDERSAPDEAPGGRRWTRWVLRAAAALVALAVIGAIVFVVATRNPEPGDFYDPPDDVEGDPGTILRSEPFTAGIPEGAEAWRILYVSTDEHDRPIAVSGLVIAATDAPAGPRPVLAWAHGTTGVVEACAPSNTDAPLEGIPTWRARWPRGGCWR